MQVATFYMKNLMPMFLQEREFRFPLLYRDTEDDPENINIGGGLAEKLADDTLDLLISRMDLPVDHLSYLAGMCHGSLAT